MKKIKLLITILVLISSILVVNALTPEQVLSNTPNCSDWTNVKTTSDVINKTTAASLKPYLSNGIIMFDLHVDNIRKVNDTFYEKYDEVIQLAFGRIDNGQYYWDGLTYKECKSAYNVTYCQDKLYSQIKEVGKHRLMNGWCENIVELSKDIEIKDAETNFYNDTFTEINLN